MTADPESQTSAEPVLCIRGLEVRAPSGAVILSGVDFDLVAGGRALVVGASGSGKSRFLRVINRLDEPFAGTIEVFGRSLFDWPPGELRRRVGWVPQKPALSAGTARQCLEVVCDLGLLPGRDLAAAVERVTAVCGLGPVLLNRPAAELSGGERHRVAIARALLLAPRLLLLDEPSGALDGAGAARLFRGLMDWQNETGAALVVVTHRIEDAHTLGGRMLVLEAGRVVRSGPTGELLADPRGYDVRALLTGVPGLEPGP